ncbi:MAG: NADH-quinone oxidoreductase subunit L [Gammaproteobacteria bacterium]
MNFNLDVNVQHCAVILLAPLVGSLIAGFFGQQLGRRFTHVISNLAVLLSCILAWILWWKVKLISNGDPNFRVELDWYTWAKWGDYEISLGFLVDRLSSMMLGVVTTVSWLVHCYSIAYMHEDRSYQRFFSYIGLFTFFMLLLVFSNNLLQMFMGWEGVGLVSYLLIGFWYTKDSAIAANLKAFIINRISDLGFMLGMAACFFIFKTLDFFEMFNQIGTIAQQQVQVNVDGDFMMNALPLIALCLFIGAMGKSAQVPLHVWLPDSMEGPTPISALIHAATMVTAGIFMIARMGPLYSYAPYILHFMMVIGTITCLGMGLVGLVQNDIKRIVAYSTISQLGFMVIGLGVQAYDCSMFHLVTHAFFKALLFLGAGSVILSLHHEQNIWRMGKLAKYLPITQVTMLIATLALVGFPGFSGYFSKDFILEALLEYKQHNPGTVADWVYPLTLLSVLTTALYSFRLYFVVFWSEPKYAHSKESQEGIKESNWLVTLPLAILAVFTLLSGSWFVDEIVDSTRLSQNMWEKTWAGFLHLPFIFVLFSAGLIWFLYIKKPEIPQKIKNKFPVFYRVLEEKYGFDYLYQEIILPFFRNFCHWCWRFLDQKMIDKTGVHGSVQQISSLAEILRYLQNGALADYALALILAAIVLVFGMYWNIQWNI